MGTTTYNKAQFNPSTLKASYNSATGKAQMITPIVINCVHCANEAAPLEIDLTFSGITDCICWVAAPWACTPGGQAAALNGTHRLVWDSGCVWKKVFAFGPIRESRSSIDCADCAGQALCTMDWREYTIKATENAGNIVVTVDVLGDGLSPGTAPPCVSQGPGYEVTIETFNATITYSGGESCFNTSNSGSNIGACGVKLGGDYPIIESGSVTVAIP